MRPTWIVLGVVVVLGSVAYVKLRAKANDASPAPLARPADAAAAKPVGQPVGMNAADVVPVAHTPGAGMAGAPSMAEGAVPLAAQAPSADAPDALETQAHALRALLAEKLAAGDGSAAAALEAQLEKEYGDTDEARRAGLERGIADARLALDDRKPLDARTQAGVRARRTLSRAIFLPELFDATTGLPVEARAKLLSTIAAVQAFVMTYGDGIAGVTRPYEVIAGDSPLRIVSRDKLPIGPHALLFWNQGGSLDPKRLKAGDRLLVPIETLSIRVSLKRHLLDIYLGEALVKEFNVGVGKASTPTPPGTYEVKDKYLNPDWHSPNGVIPYGDPRNELGDAWIPISSPEKPKGYGIHGTIRPDTVGTDCSNGCVRLRNEEAVEMTGWVRTAKNEGQATKVYIR